MGKDGIQIGSGKADEPFVLGNAFAAQVKDFIKALSNHTHTMPNGNTGTATFAPPIQLDVPLSKKHKTEE